MSRVRPGWVAAAVFAVAIVWLLSASLLGGKVLSSSDLALFEPPFAAHRPTDVTHPANTGLTDPTYIYEPDLFKARAAIRSGHLPLWTPDIDAGRPLLASQQAGSLYPLHGLAYVLPFWRSLALIAALKLLVAALGVYWFCRSLGLRPAASILGGLAFGVGITLVVFLRHPELNVFCLLGWMFWLVRRLMARGRARDALGLGALVGVALLGGHPESFLVVLLGILAYAAFELAGRARRLGTEAQLRRRSLVLVGGLALGAALGAISLLPFLELLTQSLHPSRAGDPDPAKLLYGFTFPEFWGRPDKMVFPGFPGGFAESAVYVGAFPLLLAAGGLAVRRDRTQLFLAGLALVTIAVALHTPLHALAGALPGLNLVFLHFFVFLAVFGVAVLGAIGLDRLIDAERAERRRALIVMAALVVIPVLGPLRHVHFGAHLAAALGNLPTLDAATRDSDVAALGSMLRWLFLGGACCAAAALLLRRSAGQAFAVFAIAVTAADLVSLGRGYHPALPKSVVEPPVPASIAALRRVAPGERMAGLAALTPNLAERYGLRDVRGEELPRLRRHTRLFAALGGVVDARSGKHYIFDARRSGRLLDAFAVGRLLDAGDRPPPPQTFPALTQPGERVLVNTRALPRAYVAYRWRSASDAGAGLALTRASARGALRDTPVVEDAPASPGGATQPAGPATIERAADQETVVSYRAARPGYLVLTDTYYPGWQASVNGRRTGIRPANAAFRAVRVPPGRGTVVFRYRPWPARAGAALSLAALCMLAGGAALLLGRRRRARAATPR